MFEIGTEEYLKHGIQMTPGQDKDPRKDPLLTYADLKKRNLLGQKSNSKRKTSKRKKETQTEQYTYELYQRFIEEKILTEQDLVADAFKAAFPWVAKGAGALLAIGLLGAFYGLKVAKNKMIEKPGLYLRNSDDALKQMFELHDLIAKFRSSKGWFGKIAPKAQEKTHDFLSNKIYNTQGTKLAVGVYTHADAMVLSGAIKFLETKVKEVAKKEAQQQQQETAEQETEQEGQATPTQTAENPDKLQQNSFTYDHYKKLIQEQTSSTQQSDQEAAGTTTTSTTETSPPATSGGEQQNQDQNQEGQGEGVGNAKVVSIEVTNKEMTTWLKQTWKTSDEFKKYSNQTIGNIKKIIEDFNKEIEKIDESIALLSSEDLLTENKPFESEFLNARLDLILEKNSNQPQKKKQKKIIEEELEFVFDRASMLADDKAFEAELLLLEKKKKRTIDPKIEAQFKYDGKPPQGSNKRTGSRTNMDKAIFGIDGKIGDLDFRDEDDRKKKKKGSDKHTGSRTNMDKAIGIDRDGKGMGDLTIPDIFTPLEDGKLKVTAGKKRIMAALRAYGLKNKETKLSQAAKMLYKILDNKPEKEEDSKKYREEMQKKLGAEETPTPESVEKAAKKAKKDVKETPDEETEENSSEDKKNPDDVEIEEIEDESDSSEEEENQKDSDQDKTEAEMLLHKMKKKLGNKVQELKKTYTGESVLTEIYEERAARFLSKFGDKKLTNEKGAPAKMKAELEKLVKETLTDTFIADTKEFLEERGVKIVDNAIQKILQNQNILEISDSLIKGIFDTLYKDIDVKDKNKAKDFKRFYDCATGKECHYSPSTATADSAKTKEIKTSLAEIEPQLKEAKEKYEEAKEKYEKFKEEYDKKLSDSDGEDTKNLKDRFTLFKTNATEAKNEYEALKKIKDGLDKALKAEGDKRKGILNNLFDSENIQNFKDNIKTDVINKVGGYFGISNLGSKINPPVAT